MAMENPLNWGFDGNNNYKWEIFHCHVWLLEGPKPSLQFELLSQVTSLKTRSQAWLADSGEPTASTTPTASFFQHHLSHQGRTAIWAAPDFGIWSLKIDASPMIIIFHSDSTILGELPLFWDTYEICQHMSIYRPFPQRWSSGWLFNGRNGR